MKRFSGRELHEMPWFPQLWRDELTEFLSFFALHSGVYRPALERIAGLLEQYDLPETYTDLCAGAGVYELGFVRKLRALSGRDLKVRLTDLYPNLHWPALARLGRGSILAGDRPLGAAEAIRRHEGLHVMFSGLHHFSPEEVAAMLRDAAHGRRVLAFFDYSRRSVLKELPPMVFSLPFLAVTAPLVWPFSWKRLFFSWLVPVLPLLLWVDGWISRLRAYRPEELRRLAAEAGLPADAVWECEEMPVFGGAGAVTCLVLIPGAVAARTRAGTSRGEVAFFPAE